MSQTAFITSKSFLDTPNVSYKDDSSFLFQTSVFETDTSLSTNQSFQNSSNDSIQKPRYIEKSVDEITEKLKVLQTRLDFKLTIANISKTPTSKGKVTQTIEIPKISSAYINEPLKENKNLVNVIACKNQTEQKDKISYPATPYPSTRNKTSDTCLTCIKDAQTRLHSSTCPNTTVDCCMNISNERKLSHNDHENYIWTGSLPLRNYKNPKYSNKVFLGGIPWDMTEQGLQVCFKQFGSCVFEWPGKDIESGRHPPKGYVYVLFENERSVKSLLYNCIHGSVDNNGEYYFRIETSKNMFKNVQVIPWIISDSSHLNSFTERLDTSKTIFVGGLHGMMTAETIALIFNQLFGGVIYAGIDTDKHKYPIGSGRITFNNYQNYAKAIRAKFVEIKTPKFVKRVQIDPYLEDSICSQCSSKQGPFFCREFSCYRYFCNDCWHWTHNNLELKNHRPVTRQARQNLPFDLSLFSDKVNPIP